MSDATSTRAAEPKRKFKLPSAYTILFALIVIMAIATWVVPAGTYDVGDDGSPLPGTYHEVDSHPARILVDSLTAPINGLFGVESADGNINYYNSGTLFGAIDVALFIVVIGGFLAVSDGRYLNYLPSVGKLGVLSRQPTGDLPKLAASLESAESGHVPAAVDPSRGALLSLIVQRPSVMERIEHGEAVGYVIIVVGVIASVLAVYQAAFLFRTRRAVKRQLADIANPRDDNPLGRVLTSFRADPTSIEEDAELAELRISEAVLREVPRLERFQPFLRLAVAAGPLLGLIGTVIGMIITFQSITESGSSDPRLMANGISQAMIATVLGLGIAIPLLFVNAGLASMSRSVVQILDEQSTGMLAESLEREKERHEGGGGGLLGPRGGGQRA